MDKYQVAQKIRERLIRRANSISNEYGYSKKLVLDIVNDYLNPNWLGLAKYKEYSNGWYIGMLDSDGKCQGMGAMLWRDGDIYIGDWHCDEKWDDEGIKLQSSDNGLYIGGFRNGKLHGHVYVHYPPGYCEYYEAIFENGNVKEKIRERYADGIVRDSNSGSGSGGWCGCIVVIIIILVVISLIAR